MGKIKGQPFGLVVSKTKSQAITDSTVAGNEAKFYLVKTRDDDTGEEVDSTLIGATTDGKGNQADACGIIINGNLIRGISAGQANKINNAASSETVNSVSSVANAAKTAAATAQTKADSAYTLANTANTTANAAKASAETANNTATNAWNKVKDLTNILTWKNTVADLKALQALTGVKAGDVYNVKSTVTLDGQTYPAYTNFVAIKDGKGTDPGIWDSLGGTQMDLSLLAGTSLSYDSKTNKLGVDFSGQDMTVSSNGRYVEVLNGDGKKALNQTQLWLNPDQFTYDATNIVSLNLSSFIRSPLAVESGAITLSSLEVASNSTPHTSSTDGSKSIELSTNGPIKGVSIPIGSGLDNENGILSVKSNDKALSISTYGVSIDPTKLFITNLPLRMLELIDNTQLELLFGSSLTASNDALEVNCGDGLKIATDSSKEKRLTLDISSTLSFDENNQLSISSAFCQLTTSAACYLEKNILYLGTSYDYPISGVGIPCGSGIDISNNKLEIALSSDLSFDSTGSLQISKKNFYGGDLSFKDIGGGLKVQGYSDINYTLKGNATYANSFTLRVGSGILPSDIISVYVDNSTIGFDDQGKLECKLKGDGLITTVGGKISLNMPTITPSTYYELATSVFLRGGDYIGLKLSSGYSTNSSLSTDIAGDDSGRTLLDYNYNGLYISSSKLTQFIKKVIAAM